MGHARGIALLFVVNGCAVCAMAAPPEPAPPFDPFGVDAPLPPILAAVLDGDQDGAVSDAEASASLQNWSDLARKKTPLSRMLVLALDANGNGRLSEEEIAAGVARGRKASRGVAPEVRTIFESLDKDGDKRISVLEFRGLIVQLGPLGLILGPKIGQFFDAMDVDGDRQISPAESQRGADYLAQQIEWERQRQAQLGKLRHPLFLQSQHLVASLDRNRDGRISTREAARNQDVKRDFPLADADGDGQLSVDECFAHLETLEARRKKEPEGKNPIRPQ